MSNTRYIVPPKRPIGLIGMDSGNPGGGMLIPGGGGPEPPSQPPPGYESNGNMIGNYRVSGNERIIEFNDSLVGSTAYAVGSSSVTSTVMNPSGLCAFSNSDGRIRVWKFGDYNNPVYDDTIADAGRVALDITDEKLFVVYDNGESFSTARVRLRRYSLDPFELDVDIEAPTSLHNGLDWRIAAVKEGYLYSCRYAHDDWSNNAMIKYDFDFNLVSVRGGLASPVEAHIKAFCGNLSGGINILDMKNNVIQSLDSDWSIIWSYPFEFDTAIVDPAAEGLCIDREGNTYIAGDSSVIRRLSLDNEGNLRWHRTDDERRLNGCDIQQDTGRFFFCDTFTDQRVMEGNPANGDIINTSSFSVGSYMLVKNHPGRLGFFR